MLFGSGALIPWEMDFHTEFGALETLHTAEKGVPARIPTIRLIRVKGMSLG